ncbi:MAG: FAD-dependent oxidoreductase [Sedimentibacter sp.]
MDLSKKITTDVLIIGGGMSGLLAAIKAKKEGADVVLVDKGHAGKSGQSPYADSFCPYNPEWGHDLDKWMKQVNVSGEYMNDPRWTKLVFEGSFKCYEEMVKWGVDFLKNSDSTLFKKGDLGGGPSTIFYKKNQAPGLARKEAIKLGIRIIDRVMVTDLVKNDHKVIGAIGISVEEADLYVFNSKVTVMCAGAVGFKPNGWPIHELTGDADAMAYRIGAEVLGKEFIDTHMTTAENPAYQSFAEQMSEGALPNTGPKFKLVNGDGNVRQYLYKGLWLSNEFEIHQGKGPINAEFPDGSIVKFAGGTSLGMACHKTEGIVPKDLSCATEIEGLFAAGDALGNMAAGSVYPLMGFAITHACVTGCVAGTNAAKYALKEENESISDEKIEMFKANIFAPLERSSGFDPRWAIDVLKNTLTPYFILYIKHETRLEGALAYIEFMSNHIVPKLKANDAHELRLAIEVKNMLLSAEIKLKSSLERKESRGTHYREDYPKRDDENFLAWIKLKEVDGKMNVRVDPIPKEYLPDLTIPYEERYPVRIPNEFN